MNINFNYAAFLEIINVSIDNQNSFNKTAFTKKILRIMYGEESLFLENQYVQSLNNMRRSTKEIASNIDNKEEKVREMLEEFISENVEADKLKNMLILFIDDFEKESYKKNIFLSCQDETISCFVHKSLRYSILNGRNSSGSIEEVNKVLKEYLMKIEQEKVLELANPTLVNTEISPNRPSGKVERLPQEESTNMMEDIINQLSNITDILNNKTVNEASIKTTENNTRLIAGWGPGSRETFTSENPAHYPTFNSICEVGNDERKFVAIRKLNDLTWKPEIDVVDGQTYEVYNFYHNNAASDLNDEAHNYIGIAKDVRMEASIPKIVRANESGRITTFISSSNTNPETVWDAVLINNLSKKDIYINYVSKSATIYNRGKTNEKNLNGLLNKNGSKIGYNSLDGIIPGCEEYSGHVVYQLKATYSNFEVKVEVSKHNQYKWEKSIDVASGEIIDYRVTFKNTGFSDLKEVLVRCESLFETSYINGSTKIICSKGSNTNAPDGIMDDKVKYSLDSFKQNQGGTIFFSAKIKESTSDFLKHSIYIDVDDITKGDSIGLRVF